ncbi:hypothetical protein BGX28_003399 [Mortierella sp. GBA30]|nr:hypothetical protein BGX28_003399 [Mortierella sp. GBA30]
MTSQQATQQAQRNSFPDLVELDALRLTVIVDNEVDFMSSVPKELGLTTLASKLFKDGRNLDKEKCTVQAAESSTERDRHHSHAEDGTGVRTVAFDFNDICCGAHGLSILVTGIKDNVEHSVLFDTGPHSAVFLENAKRLEIEFEKIEVIVLSHWHIDHSGGMLAAVEQCRKARSKFNSQSSVTVDLHPDRPDQRGAALSKPSPSGEAPALLEYVAWGRDPLPQELKEAGGDISWNGIAHTVCDGFFGVSGMIPRNTSYETGLPSHVRWSNETRSWSSEPEIMDERYLVARIKSKGLVVLTGCSHAGVINVCQDVERAFRSNEQADSGANGLFFVVGGFHLAGLSVETRIKETVDDMRTLNPSYMAPGHCSGWRAKAALEQAMPGKVVTLGVGSEFFIANEHEVKEPAVSVASSGRAQSHLVSIFDIPIIVDMIFRYLPRDDYFKCALVNRTFRNESNRHIWGELMGRQTGYNPSQTLNQNDQKAILLNSRWIRRLNLGYYTLLAPILTGPRSNCNNLTELECLLSHNQTADTITLIALIERSLSLEILSVAFENQERPSSDNQAFEDLIATLKVHPTLQDITVRDFNVWGREGFQKFLIHLPRTLRQFTFIDDYQYREVEAADSGEIDQSMSHTVDSQWPDSYPFLESVTFNGGRSMAPILLSLLERCPALEALGLPSLVKRSSERIGAVIQQKCPKVRRLEVYGPDLMDDVDILPIVRQAPNIDLFFGQGELYSSGTFVRAMIDHWSTTLKSVMFEVDFYIKSADIQRILTSCPNLTTFSAHGETESHGLMLSLSDMVRSPWVCVNLERLTIKLMDERTEQATAEEHWRQEALTQTRIRGAFNQLSRLARLKHLTIGWRNAFRGAVESIGSTSSRHAPVVQLDMSLDSGLAQLSTLTELRSLNVQWIWRLAMEEDELQWAVENWPKLRHLHGLSKAYGEWLQETRPSVNCL